VPRTVRDSTRRAGPDLNRLFQVPLTTRPNFSAAHPSSGLRDAYTSLFTPLVAARRLSGESGRVYFLRRGSGGIQDHLSVSWAGLAPALPSRGFGEPVFLPAGLR